MKMNNGVVHVEIKLSGNGPQLIELNARMGGLFTWHGVKSLWGVDLLLHAYEIALGVPVSHLPSRGLLDINSPEPSKMYLVAKYPNAPFTGYVLKDDLISSIRKKTSVSYAFSMAKKGQKVYGPENDRPWWLAMFLVTGYMSMEATEKEANKLVQDLNLSSVLSKKSPLQVSAAPVVGMEDTFGLPVRQFHAVSRALEFVAYRFGYEEISIPIVERATSFSEDVVGHSPWPEWNSKGCFFFDIVDYSEGFSVQNGKTPVVLIPEGTISVARWLGQQINTDPDIAFPIKIFYNTPCFRNEPTDTLSHRKKRQFDQFGIEILGTQNLGADVEIIWMIGEMMEALGISKSDMIVRVSNIQILLRLLNDSKIVHPDDIRIKEAMDEMAECRASGEFDCVEKNKAHFFEVLNEYPLTKVMEDAWDAMLHHDSGIVDNSLRSKFPASYEALFDELELISTQLVKHHLKVIADLCVVRSHEYYTHFSFEIDVKVEETTYLEIAGGGRYNKLVGHFITNENIKADRYVNVVPSTGFAFGMQRLIAMLKDARVFNSLNQNVKLPLSESGADVLLIPNIAKSNEVESYLLAQEWIQNNTKSKTDNPKRYDIYLGDHNTEDYIRSYKQKRMIPKTVRMP